MLMGRLHTDWDAKPHHWLDKSTMATGPERGLPRPNRSPPLGDDRRKIDEIYLLSHDICSAASQHYAAGTTPSQSELQGLMDHCIRSYDLLRSLASRPRPAAILPPRASVITPTNEQLQVAPKLPPISSFYRVASAQFPQAGQSSLIQAAAQLIRPAGVDGMLLASEPKGPSPAWSIRSLPPAGGRGVASPSMQSQDFGGESSSASPTQAFFPRNRYHSASDPFDTRRSKRSNSPDARASSSSFAILSNSRPDDWRTVQAFREESIKSPTPSSTSTVSSASYLQHESSTGRVGGLTLKRSLSPPKYSKRSRRPVVTACQCCGSKGSPEWRRGPLGARTLCNACGLHYAKLLRTGEQAASRSTVNDPDAILEELRAMVQSLTSGSDTSANAITSSTSASHRTTNMDTS